MTTYYIDADNYNAETRVLTLHGPVVREDVKVISRSTGVDKPFAYCEDWTSQEYMNNEGWDGEQDLAIFYNSELDVTLRVWEVPGDVWNA